MNSKELKALNSKVSEASWKLRGKLDNIRMTNYFSNLLNINIKEEKHFRRDLPKKQALTIKQHAQLRSVWWLLRYHLGKVSMPEIDAYLWMSEGCFLAASLAKSYPMEINEALSLDISEPLFEELETFMDSFQYDYEC